MSMRKLFSGKNEKYHPVDKKIVRAFNKPRTSEQRKHLCHAPFKSMCFFHTGDVLACWYNKLFPLGKYPDDSIHDIWFSKRADKLRDYINHNDLSYGCADCRKSLSSGNLFSVYASRYDFLPPKTNEYPVSLDFQISNTCNLQCIMCNGEYSAKVRMGRENQALYKNPYDENFFQQLAPFIPQLKEASFSGGEAFLIKEYYRIWDMMILENPGIIISATTNGNLLNDKILKYLNALSFNITVSIDAITEETYRRIRVNGDFNAVIKNIQTLLDYTKEKGTDFSVKICAMRQNWNELPELSNYLNEKNIPFQFNTVIYPPYCSLWNLSSGKLEEISGFLRGYSISDKTVFQKENNIRYLGLIHQLEGWQKEAQTREQNDFFQLSLNQLSDVFINKIQNYLAEELNYMRDENPLKIEEIKEITQRWINDSPSDDVALRGMQYYASAPVERILAEIEIRDYEKNLDRFLQAGLKEDN
jgi:MoaA/NifB/PqqE/SkfB family radical SAM enzyme